MRLDSDLKNIVSVVNMKQFPDFRNKVLFAMPLGKDAPPPTSFVKWSSLLLTAERSVGGIGFFSAYRMPVIATRTAIAEAFLNSEYEWMFCLDYDMVYEPNDLLRLLDVVQKHPKIKMISGTARMGGEPHSPVLYKRHEGGFRLVSAWPRDKLFTIDRIGLFGYLVNRSVFEQVPRPWYGGLDECWYFCDLMARSDIKIWVDPRMVFGHIGESLVDGTPNRYEDIEVEL